MNNIYINNKKGNKVSEGTVEVTLENKVVFSNSGYVISINNQIFHIELNKIGLFICKLICSESSMLQKDVYVLRNSRKSELYSKIESSGYESIVSIETDGNNTYVHISDQGNNAIYGKEGSIIKSKTDVQPNILQDENDNPYETVVVQIESSNIETESNLSTSEDLLSVEVKKNNYIDNTVECILQYIKSQDDKAISNLVKMPSSREFAILQENIIKVLPELSIPEYFYFIKFLLNDNQGRFTRSISITNYTHLHNLSSYKSEINTLIPSLFKGGKTEHAYNIISPYFHSLSKDNVELILKKVKDMKGYESFLDIVEKLGKTRPVDKIDWLCSTNTKDSLFAAFTIIDTIQNNIPLKDKIELLKRLKESEYYEIFASYLNSSRRNSDYSELYLEFSQKILSLKQKKKNKQALKFTLNPGIIKEFKIMSKTLHHYILTAGNIRAIMPFSFTVNGKSHKKLTLTQCKVLHCFEKKGIVIVSELGGNDRNWMNETILRVNDNITVQFCLRGKELFASVHGSNIYEYLRINVLNIPRRNFDYKQKYPAVVTSVDSFFNYSVKLL